MNAIKVKEIKSCAPSLLPSENKTTITSELADRNLHTHARGAIKLLLFLGLLLLWHLSLHFAHFCSPILFVFFVLPYFAGFTYIIFAFILLMLHIPLHLLLL